MSIRPDLRVPVATAQAIVDGVLPGHRVAAVSEIHGGEIAATYEIAFGGAEQPVILKVYPDSLRWKMQKEATVASLIQARLSVPVPRILLADDSKRLLGLNFILMTKLAGSILGGFESTLNKRPAGFRLQADRTFASRISSHSDGSIRLHRRERNFDGALDQSRLPVVSV